MYVRVDPQYQRKVGLHLALTFMTCGFWLPVWAFIEFIRWATKR